MLHAYLTSEYDMTRTTLAATAVLLASVSSLAVALPRANHWEGKIVGKSSPKIKGEASMRAGKMANTLVINVKLTGDAPNMTRPWHVHTGSCATAGGVYGAPTAYTPLAGNKKGASKGMATLSMPVPADGSYYVNIHESATAMATIIACGDLKFEK